MWGQTVSSFASTKRLSSQWFWWSEEPIFEITCLWSAVMKLVAWALGVSFSFTHWEWENAIALSEDTEKHEVWSCIFLIKLFLFQRVIWVKWEKPHFPIELVCLHLRQDPEQRAHVSISLCSLQFCGISEPISCQGAPWGSRQFCFLSLSNIKQPHVMQDFLKTLHMEQMRDSFQTCLIDGHIEAEHSGNFGLWNEKERLFAFLGGGEAYLWNCLKMTFSDPFAPK